MEKRAVKHMMVVIDKKVRYILVDENTGEVVDDAQGYGYKSIKGAYSAYKYKTLSKEEKIQREETIEKIHTWCRENKGVVRCFNEVEYEIMKGSWGPDDKLDEKLAQQLLEQKGYKVEELGFSVKNLLKYYGS